MYTLITWKEILHKVIPYVDTVMSDSNFYLDL